jgi:hypothetical protein
VRVWPLLLLAAVAACGGDGDCPLIGCVSQLTVQLPPGAVSGRACVAEVCTTEVVDGVLQVPLSRRTEGNSVDVLVEVVDGSGATSTVTGDAAVRRTRPNGEGCPQVCVNGAVRLDGAGGLVDVGELSPTSAPS